MSIYIRITHELAQRTAFMSKLVIDVKVVHPFFSAHASWQKHEATLGQTVPRSDQLIKLYTVSDDTTVQKFVYKCDIRPGNGPIK